MRFNKDVLSSFAMHSQMYRVSHLVVDWVGLTWILSVPLSARFCLGWWEFGRSGWAAGKLDRRTRWWNTQIKVDPTQVHEQMEHPVFRIRIA